MKVLHLISGGDSGGGRTHVLSLLRELNSSEDVLLLCLREGPTAASAREAGLPLRVLSGGFAEGCRAVEREVKEGGWALLHCHGSRANLTGALLRPRLGIPVISTIHSDPRLDYLGRPTAALTYGALNALALRRMDALVCVSEAMKNTLRARRFPAERLYTIFNGTERPASLPEADGWLEGHGVRAGAEDILLGTAARLDPVKEHATLLRGFALAQKRDPRLRLLLAGNGPEEARLRALAETLGIADRVHFLGWVEDMPGFYASLHINVLPSRWETFPYALTDGAHFALPAVASDTGGMPEIVGHGVGGYLFPVGDAAALAEALLRLAEDAELRHAMGNALQTRVEERFSLRTMGERQRDIYESILTPRRSIVVAGACGQGNLGDEAMLAALLPELRRADPMSCITVLSRSPAQTAAEFGTESVHALRPLRVWRALRRSRILLPGGGNLWQDATSRRSLRYYTALVAAAKRAGCRVAVWGAGVGPLSEAGWKKTVRALQKTDLVIFREEESLRAAREAGLQTPEMILAADPALALAPPSAEGIAAVREKLALPSSRGYIALCLRPWPGTEKTAEAVCTGAAAFAAETGREAVLLPLNRAQDLSGMDSLPLRRLPAPETAEEALAVLGCMDAVVSMRLHGLVLGALAGVPGVGLACDGRIEAFQKAMDRPALPAGAVSAEEVKHALAEALEKGRPAEAIARQRALWEQGAARLRKEVVRHG